MIRNSFCVDKFHQEKLSERETLLKNVGCGQQRFPWPNSLLCSNRNPITRRTIGRRRGYWIHNHKDMVKATSDCQRRIRSLRIFLENNHNDIVSNMSLSLQLLAIGGFGKWK